MPNQLDDYALKINLVSLPTKTSNEGFKGSSEWNSELAYSLKF